MDVEEAKKFINSLVKNLQVLCHGHVNFNNSIQVIGHLYLNVDSQTNIDYIVNEKVCKNDNSSTMFVSNSYHSEPKIKKKSKDSTNNNNSSSESKDQRPQESQELKKHQKPQRAAERETDFQSSFSGHRSPHTSQIHQQVYKRPSQDILSPILRQENSGKKRLRMSETSSESPMLNLSNIKSEPQEIDKEEESDYNDHNPSSQGSIEELSNEFISGIRDNKLAVYPVAVHSNDINMPFNLPQISTPSSSFHSTDGDSGGTPFQVQPEPLSLSSLFGPTRKSYSVCMKKKMCQYKEANPSATYNEIIELWKTEYNIEIIKPTLAAILREKDKWLNIPEDPSYFGTFKTRLNRK